MPTKITDIYDNPEDPEVFEADYEQQIILASQVDGVQRIESSKIWSEEDGTAVTTAAAGAFFADVFARATGGVRITFADIDQSRAVGPA